MITRSQARRLLSPVLIPLAILLLSFTSWAVSGPTIINPNQIGASLTTLTLNSTTPSVSNGFSFLAANTTATAITVFTDAPPGKQIIVICGDSFTSMVGGTYLSLTAPFSCSPGSVISLVLYGNIWYEISRSSSATSTVVVSDTFSYGDGALSANWVANLNSLTVVSHTVEGVASAASNIESWNSTVNAFTGQEFSQLTVASIGVNFGGPAVMMDASGTANGYACMESSGTTIYLYKFVTGVATSLASGTVTAGANGDVMRLEAVPNFSGTQTVLTCYRNGTVIITWTDASSPFTSGQPGIEITSNVATQAINNWSGGQFVIPGGGGSQFNGGTITNPLNIISTLTANSISTALQLGSNGYPCTSAGVLSAEGAISNGGTIDATGCPGAITPGGQLVLSTSNITLILGQQKWNFLSGTSPSIYVTGNNVVIQCKQNQSIITSADVGAVGTDKYIIQLAGNQDEIRNCQIQGQTTSGANNSQLAVVITGANSKVVDNFFSGTDGSHGLTYAVVNSSATGSQIKGNIVQNLQVNSSGYAMGVLLTGGGPGEISGNQINLPATAPQAAHHIYLSQASIEWEVHDNILLGGCTQIQIYATDAQSTAEYNDIHNNLIIGSGTVSGVVGSITISNNATHNSIRDNTILNYAEGPGIEVVMGGGGTTKPPNYNRITGNHLFNIGTYGILIAGASGTFVEGNEVRNNSTLSLGTYDGIFIEGDVTSGNSTQVLDNYVTNTGGSGAFHGALNISSNSPVATGTLVIGNSFDAGSNGTIIDGGSGTLYGPNLENGLLTIHNLKSNSGTRYICVGTSGQITSSASACSGT